MLSRFSIAALLLCSAASAQNTTPVAFESFDYPVGGVGGNNGGTGWVNEWWAGTSQSDGLVVAGSVDAVGNAFNTQEQWAGSFRRIDTSPHSIIAPNGKIGSAEGTMWIRFWIQKPAFSTDTYGGMFLHDSDAGAQVFIGAPGLSTEWGLQQSTNYSNTVTAAGTDIDVLTQLVVRIDHVFGGTTLSLWSNPGVPYPGTQADCSVVVDDFQWDYIWLASGNNGGGNTGYLFDEIVIEREGTGSNSLGTSYCTAAPNSTGAPASIAAYGSTTVATNNLQLVGTGLPLSQFAYFITGQTPGFIGGPGGSQGNLCIIGQLGRFTRPGEIKNSGTTGDVDLTVDLGNIPLTTNPSILPGETWNFTLWYRDLNPNPTSNFTDAVTITFQ